MKLVLTLLVRDESDIIRENIRYHLSRGVDHIIATDNNSVDATTEILRDFEKQGVLELIHEPEDTYDQSAWVSRMAVMAAERFGADWIIHCDADEFYWPLSGGLKAELERIPPEFVSASLLRFNFIPRPEGRGSLFERMIIKDLRSTNHIGRPLPPKICHRPLKDVIIGQGNHGITKPANLKHYAAAPIEILHFPMRTYKQFANKIALGGAAYQRNTKIPPTAARGWRLLFEEYNKGNLPAYYESKVLSDEAVAQGLSEGRLAVDERLRNYLKNNQIVD